MKIQSWLTSENIKKVMDSLNKVIKVFNENIQDFGKSMGTIVREMSSDVSSSKEHRERESRKKQKNIEKLWGNSNKVKIWSDK